MPRPTGKCHICGEIGLLSKEHIPPQAAYNNSHYSVVNGLDALRRFAGEKIKPKYLQGGYHQYSLCESCNSLTGRWYGNAYIWWANEGVHHLIASNCKPSLYYVHHGFPLRIIKEIVAMFLSINTAELADAIPYLRRFVLNKHLKGLPDDLRIYCYYTSASHGRSVGMMSALETGSGTVHYSSEFSHMPYGYVMSWRSIPKDRRLREITHFAKYGYDEFVDFQLRLTNLPIHLPIPGDYRTEKEIEEDRILNTTPKAEVYADPDQVQAFRAMSAKAMSNLFNLGVCRENATWLTAGLPANFLDSPGELID